MIENLFKKQQGYLHTKDLHRNRKMQYDLQKMLENGEVQRLKRGLYKHPSYATLNHWQEVSLMYPQAVYCLHSACAYYQLSTYIPPTNHMAIGSKQKLVLADYPPVKLYYWSPVIFKQHITEQNGVRVYSLERTVCDAIKYKLQMGQDMIKEVAESYLQRKDHNIQLLMQTAKQIKVYNRVEQIFSILL